jgi:hypothetical protein
MAVPGLKLMLVRPAGCLADVWRAGITRRLKQPGNITQDLGNNYSYWIGESGVFGIFYTHTEYWGIKIMLHLISTYYLYFLEACFWHFWKLGTFRTFGSLAHLEPWNFSHFWNLGTGTLEAGTLEAGTLEAGTLEAGTFPSWYFSKLAVLEADAWKLGTRSVGGGRGTR